MEDRWLRVNVAKQELEVREGDRVLACFPVSTAANGVGEEDGSERTPRGAHEVREKIGAGAPSGTVFTAREPTGEVFTRELREQHPDRDWILTRILWLSGLEDGRNRGGKVDSHARYIYIHGTPDEEPMGEPRSHGCVRMRNDDVIALFDEVEVGTRVVIDG